MPSRLLERNVLWSVYEVISLVSDIHDRGKDPLGLAEFENQLVYVKVKGIFRGMKTWQVYMVKGLDQLVYKNETIFFRNDPRIEVKR